MALYIRKPLFDSLWNALHGKPRLMQVITGPRQVGKTTVAVQIIERWKGGTLYETADQPNPPSADWIISQWEKARGLIKRSSGDTLLVLDEVQKIPRWSETVKRLFDEDHRAGCRLRVLLLGSSALLVQRGLTESLAGRFELHRHPHWSYSECRDYFQLGLDDYLVFGGYPAGLGLRKDPIRWNRYIRESLIETVIGKDVLLMSPVQKPALLRQAFGMACAHPAEILSYQKMLGQLTDAGNTTTLAHYFNLLAAAFFLAPLSKWSGGRLRQRGSIPKIVLRDNSLVTALGSPLPVGGRLDPAWRGRLMENAAGAALMTLSEQEGAELYYWRDREDEIDYVLRVGSRLIGIEVKSGRPKPINSFAFKRRYPSSEIVVVGHGRLKKGQRQVPLRKFFLNPRAVLSA